MTAPPLDHALRATGIGGSEIAALLGTNPYAGPMSVYLAKTTPPGDRDTPAMAWGRRLERPILDAMLEKHGLAEIEHPGSVRCPTEPLALATPDALAIHTGGLCGLEAKNRSAYTKEVWGVDGSSTGVPRNIWCQAQWGLGCLPHVDRWLVGVLLGGNDFRTYWVTRDPEWFSMAMVTAEAFWRTHVVPRVPPPVDGSEASDGWLKVTFPAVTVPTIVEATGGMAQLVADCLAARQDLAEAEAEVARLTQEVKALIGDHRGIHTPQGGFTWTETRGRQKTDWEAVAQAAHVSPDLIAAHTTFGPTFRTFRETKP